MKQTSSTKWLLWAVLFDLFVIARLLETIGILPQTPVFSAGNRVILGVLFLVFFCAMWIFDKCSGRDVTAHFRKERTLRLLCLIGIVLMYIELLLPGA